MIKKMEYLLDWLVMETLLVYQSLQLYMQKLAINWSGSKVPFVQIHHSTQPFAVKTCYQQ